MTVVILTSNKYRHLLDDFSKLYNKFWDQSMPVRIFCFQMPEKHQFINYQITSLGDEDKPWAWQLLEAVKQINDKSIILFREDFYMLKKVDMERVALLVHKLETEHLARVSLQSVKDGYADCSDKLLGGLYALRDGAEYLCSMELSIWSRDFLLEFLDPTWDHWQAETELSKKAMGKAKVLVSKEPVVVYADATRGGGQKRIDNRNGELWQLKPGDVWVDTGVRI